MKKNLILLGILVLLVIFSWAWNNPIKDWKTNNGMEKNFLTGLDLVLADKMEIEKSGVLTVLEKNNGRWKVGGTKDFYVAPSDIDEVAAVLEKAVFGKLELVSSNNEKKDSFGFSDPARVKIVQGEKIYEFLVGGYTDDFIGSYVALEGSDKIYRTTGNLNVVFAKEDWRDKQIFSFSQSGVNKVRFQCNKTQFVAEKKDSVWSGISPWKFTVSEDKINEVLAVLADLRATDIPVQDFANTGLEKNNLIIQVMGEDFDNTIMVGNCTEDELCYAKRADSDNIYLITKDQKTALTKKMGDLK